MTVYPSFGRPDLGGLERLRLLGTVGVLGAAVVAFIALPALVESRTEAVPRAVAPRPPLAADEQANIELFKRTSPSVVHITTLEVQRDFFSMNVQQVPRGTGTGFVWDDSGHIVTNFHVIQGADGGAKVTLSDQSKIGRASCRERVSSPV